MLSNEAIKDRFMDAFFQVIELRTMEEVCDALNVDQRDIQALKDGKELAVGLLARFCSLYRYNPYYILTGLGDVAGDKIPTPSEEKELYYLRTIESLLNALIEIKSSWNDPTHQLVQDAMKNTR